MSSKTCSPDHFYLANTKSGSAGYDKYVFHNVSVGPWVIFKNTRTGAIKRLQAKITDNKIIIPEERFRLDFATLDIIFKKPVDFFVWNEKRDPYAKFESKQYHYELKHILEKYPEYFI